MKVGITLPQFDDSAGPALAAAREAERLGFDGVFCFDHLWPIGMPGRPVISSAPLLGAVAASTSTITVGTLVARVGLLPDGMLVATLASLSAISEGRFIAGIGTGDSQSRPENDAYGIRYGPADERRGHLGVVASAVQSLGIPVWVGGGSGKTVALAASLGAAVNLWEGDPAQVKELTAAGMEVTWGGPIGTGPAQAASQLVAMAEAGATWVVWAWPESLEAAAETVATVRSSIRAD
jgi:alkanesulfonate monooxygenase SsuD/methylene tetrahydromethanopterin reductase-like flavin-dependent oxidoreductase (luciferase family)